MGMPTELRLIIYKHALVHTTDAEDLSECTSQRNVAEKGALMRV